LKAVRRVIDAHLLNLDAKENVAMTNEAYKAWLDAMPIDDVRRRIERLEHKLSDLRVLERLHAERQPAGPETSAEPAGPETSAEPAGPETSAEPAGPETSAEPAGPKTSAEPAVEDASPESGSQPT